MRFPNLVRPERSRRAVLRRLCQAPFDFGAIAPPLRANGGSFVGRASKPPYPVPIAGDQRFLFGTCPSFDPPLKGNRFVTRRHGLAPDRLDRATPSRPLTANALVVLPQAPFQVVRVPGVIRTVGAAQQIDPELHRCRASALRLRSGRTRVGDLALRIGRLQGESATYPQKPRRLRPAPPSPWHSPAQARSRSRGGLSLRP